ncbi:NEDD8-activating enzyme E1 regulatory subunit [Fopius arisanus]|uniref:NEDD8-activating enzyme E1 regulatory subunit n=1 Tax=Fopius arisanus TaxID=64838 RepID=A0A0C9QMW4_9HYME|nr:PREDICTED: NEDD8-activating enzyme E1 regulatory subunit [Fopius arisanus]XP_011308268.1 PREDICTED: NEDD8-activating enzyme E1 regulatory subunit [Fopius arisanus]
MASPAPKSPEQSEKNRKYDRQLRLWGDHGQVALEAAHICLINATGLGTEILKSLVLPGIGAFTIVDGKKVSQEDIGANFFLDADSVGKSRAQVATQLLVELNQDVRGDYIDEGPEEILYNSPDFFNSFTVVVATALPEKFLIHLSKKLFDLNIPLIVCQSIGFIGYMRIQTQEHTIIETHPDNELPDLRLDRPFESLKQHMDSINLEEMDLKDHSHTPYVVILYKYLEKWIQERGSPPENYREKTQLRDKIKHGIRKDENGIPLDEENFEEAIRAVNTSIGHTTVPKSVLEILNDDRCVNLTAKSTSFWIIARAIRDFMENEGCGLLPVKGALPDMTADTEKYIALSQIYHKQAVSDVEAVWRHTIRLLRQLGRSSDSIPEKDVKLFCRYASDIHVERGTSIADEYDPKTINANDIAESLENPESMMVYYVVLRGLQRFQVEYNSHPGEFDDHVEPDIVKLKACISKLLGEWGCGPLAKDDYVHEFCRFGGAELHSVSAFLGGLAAQEIIKFITSQYKPIHNTFIHDAVTSNSATFFF